MKNIFINTASYSQEVIDTVTLAIASNDTAWLNALVAANPWVATDVAGWLEETVAHYAKGYMVSKTIVERQLEAVKGNAGLLCELIASEGAHPVFVKALSRIGFDSRANTKAMIAKGEEYPIVHGLVIEFLKDQIRDDNFGSEAHCLTESYWTDEIKGLVLASPQARKRAVRIFERHEIQVPAWLGA